MWERCWFSCRYMLDRVRGRGWLSCRFMLDRVRGKVRMRGNRRLCRRHVEIASRLCGMRCQIDGAAGLFVV
jgi:hypothetical protein